MMIASSTHRMITSSTHRMIASSTHRMITSSTHRQWIVRMASAVRAGCRSERMRAGLRDRPLRIPARPYAATAALKDKPVRTTPSRVTRTASATTSGTTTATTTNTTIDPRDSEFCSGCGARFQESHATHAGYLPELDHRRQAFLLGLTYEQYRKQMAGSALEARPSEVSYQRKRDMLGVVEAGVRRHVDLGGIVASTRDVENRKAFVSAVGGNATSKDQATSTSTSARLICARCHSLTEQNSLPGGEQHAPYPINEMDSYHAKLSQDALRTISKEIEAKDNAFVLALCDVTDFPHSLFLPLLRSIGKHAPILVVANKMDLLPADSNLDRLRHYIKDYLKRELDVNIVDAHLVSVQSSAGMTDLLKSVVKYRGPMDDLFVVGATNTGKSTLMNFLMRKFKAPGYRRNTTSWLPGTTMDSVSMPLRKCPAIRDFILETRSEIVADRHRQAIQRATRGKDAGTTSLRSPFPSPFAGGNSNQISKVLAGNIIDTPGVINSDSLLHLLTPEELKHVIPSKQITPVSYHVNPGTSLWLGGLGRFEYVEGTADVIMTVFANNKLPVHVSASRKAEDLWARHGGARSVDWDERLRYDVKELRALDRVESIRLRRKNVNKDYWAGVVLAPPFFTDPKKFLVDRYHGNDVKVKEGLVDSDDRDVPGLLVDRMALFPDFAQGAEKAIDHFEPVVSLKSFANHFQMAAFDMVLAGVGWVSITGNFNRERGKHGLFRAYSPAGRGVVCREPALLPFDVMRRGLKHRGMFLNQYRSPTADRVKKVVEVEAKYWNVVRKRL